MASNKKFEPKHIGHLDIETSNLVADFGIILTYCIKEHGTNKIYSGVISGKDIQNAKMGDEDKVLVKQLIRDMERFDLIVTYYGTGFDIPFIRTRALSMGLDFPIYDTIKHLDVYYTAKSKLKLSSKKLENVCRVILGKTNKTRVDSKYWRSGSRGNKEGLSYILKHNKYDVIDLEKVYNKLIPFKKRVFNSL